MAAKKRKDISQEVRKLEDEGQNASQKALEVAKFDEAAKFESLSPDFTEETSQAIGQASNELQGSIDRKQSEVLQESEDVLDKLEQKQKEFKGAIAADKSDISKLNALQAEGDVVDDSKIVQVQECKKEEINFLTGLTKDIEAVQDDINKKLNESKQRRQAARINYIPKSLDNNNQVSSSENTTETSRESGESNAEVEISLEHKIDDNSSSSNKTAQEFKTHSTTVLAGSPPFSKNVIQGFFIKTERERVGSGPESHFIRDHIATGEQSNDTNNLSNQLISKRKASMFHNQEIASQAIKEVINIHFEDIENFAKHSDTAPGENKHFHVQTSLADLGFGMDRNGNPLPRPISKVFIVIKARGDGTWLIQTAYPKS